MKETILGDGKDPGMSTKLEVMQQKVDAAFGFGTRIVLAILTTLTGVIIYHLVTTP